MFVVPYFKDMSRPNTNTTKFINNECEILFRKHCKFRITNKRVVILNNVGMMPIKKIVISLQLLAGADIPEYTSICKDPGKPDDICLIKYDNHKKDFITVNGTDIHINFNALKIHPLDFIKIKNTGVW